MEQCPKNVEQLPKSGTGAEIGSLLHELWNSSTICGTVPAKSGAGTMNSTTENTNGMLFQDVIQCTTFNCVSHRSRSSHKLSLRIIVLLLDMH